MGSAASRPDRTPAQPSQPRYEHQSTPQNGSYFMQGGHRGHDALLHHGQFQSGYGNPQLSSRGSQSRPNYPQTAGGQVADKQLNNTEIIRNAVNVKKSTILLRPVPGNPQKLAISFQFDASAPCMVTTFIAATEESSESCRITSSRQVGGRGAHFEKGLGLSFPPPSPESISQATIDVSQFNDDELLRVKETPKGAQYPLIIRLETITEKGLAEGHSLNELVPGAAQKPWLQSQTTFADLAKDDDGNYKARPVKQKIWVEGISYELQEIYGIEHATAAAKEREGVAVGMPATEQEEERNCVICMVNSRDTTVLPCRHMCMCHDCAQELRKQTSKCPICRNQVESLLHIRMARQQAPKNPATPIDQSTVSAALDKLGLKSSNEKAG